MDESEVLLKAGHGSSLADDSYTAGRESAAEAYGCLSGASPSLVLVFSSARYDLGAMLRGVRSITGESTLIGATTAGEIHGGLATGSVVVGILASPHISVRAAVGEGVSRGWRNALDKALDSEGMRPYFGDIGYYQELTKSGRSVFFFLFTPGCTHKADSRAFEITEEIKRRSKGRFPIFGGCAADDWRMDENAILFGGEVQPDALLLAAVETSLSFGIGYAHGFTPGDGKAMTVTRSDGCVVYDIDGRPAAEALALVSGLGQDVSTCVSGRKAFGINDSYGTHLITFINYFGPDGSAIFTRSIPQGTRLLPFESRSDSLVNAGKIAIRRAAIRGGIKKSAIAIVFSSAIRNRILGDGAGDAISAIRDSLPDSVPLVGFSSFGEQGISVDGSTQHNVGSVAAMLLGNEFSPAAEIAHARDEARAERESLRDQLYQSQKLETVGTLAGGIAHEFNNYLTVILGNAELAVFKTKVGDPGMRYLKRIITASERARNLVRQLVLYAKSDCEMRTDPMDLNVIVRDLAQMLEGILGDDVTLRLDLPPFPLVMRGDRGQMEQVITNLVVNGRDALKNGGDIIIRTGLSESTASAAGGGPGRFVILSVEDTGTGMSEETISKIFDPFFTTKEPGKGTGLGLSVVQGIVQRHNGWMDVRSRPGQGTVMTLYFPEAPVKDEAAERERKEPFPWAKETGERILLVEDLALVRQAIFLCMNEAGYEVVAVSGVREALDLFEKNAGRFDLLFTDVCLPDGNGLDLAGLLKAKAPGLKVLLASGYTDEARLDEIKARGYSFLQKPLRFSEMLETVRNILRG